MSKRRERELRQQNRLLVRYERMAERELVALFAGMADRVAAGYVPGAVDASLQIVEEVCRPGVERILSAHLKRAALLFGGRVLDQLAPFTKGLSSRRTKGFREIFETTILSWVQVHVLRRARTITDTQKEAVRGVIEEAQEEGTGEAGVAKAILETIGRVISRSSAARIARTEIHTAAAVGADEAARSTGLEMVKEWAAAEDKRTRLSHAKADGQTVEMDEDFTVGGILHPAVSMRFPGDPEAPAREIVNCRCVPLYHPRIGGEIIR